MDNRKFDELMENYESAVKELGLGYTTRSEILRHAEMLVNLHERKGFTWFDDKIIAEYLQDVEQRYYEGKIGKKKYNKTKCNTSRFLNFRESGIVDSPDNSLKGSRYDVLPAYERIVDAFLDSGDFHPNTKNDMRWVAHKYFAWLSEQGFDDISSAGAEQIHKFLLDCSRKHPSSSVFTIRLHLKKLYAYLYSCNLSLSAYTDLMSFPISRESKIFPALPMRDVAKLLGTIDRKPKSGKRAYAAMTLGAELGLRACDVANLQLDDIDWVRGEIKILQLKTSKTVVLPLTQKVGEALRDYILNGRPKTKERHVFLRLRKPYLPLKSAVSIGEIYRDCCKAPDSRSASPFTRCAAH